MPPPHRNAPTPLQGVNSLLLKYSIYDSCVQNDLENNANVLVYIK